MIMSKLKELFNAIYMYAYLRYYIYKLRTDSHYMLKEAIEHSELRK